jgi:plasmid stabilization system protein ParE
MKRYRVLIHPDAEAELDAAYRHIAEDSPERAARWRQTLLRKTQSLKTLPHRCPLAPESRIIGREVRHLICGVYRVLFVLEAETIIVVHVRHGARRPIGTAMPRRDADD